MAIFRQFIAPLLIVLVFVVALVAVGARIFLPSDMAAPAPIESVEPQADSGSAPVAEMPTDLETLIKGLPLDLDLESSL